MARGWRAFVDGLPERPGLELELSAEEAHHVRDVLRLRAGDELQVFDGRGGEWSATLVSVERRRVRVRLDRELPGPGPDPALRLELFQALCRADRMDWLVQKTTELGVASIAVFASARSEPERAARRKLERWRRIAVEGAKQSGRRRVPAVELVGDLPVCSGAAGTALLLDPHGGPAPLATVLDRDSSAVRLAVGPESGFDASELERWRGAGWSLAGLGPRTLRAETAAVAAVALVLHLRADLGA